MKLPPDYVCGFIDGEGCFTIVISKHPQKKLGIDARLHFLIELRDDDLEILKSIQETLGCGRIYFKNLDRYGWHPQSFEYFVQAVDIFAKKEHLNMEVVEKLYKIRESMNIYAKKLSSVR